MRGILLTLMAFVAMASVTFGAVTFDYVVTDVGVGYRTVVVRAIGTNINCLQRFEVEGNLNQVQPVADEMSLWVNDYENDGNDGYPVYVDRCPVNPADSYVMYGDMWFPDLKTLNHGDPDAPSITLEAVVSGSGVGANLKNYDEQSTPDAFVDRYAVMDGSVQTLNLLQLAIPDGEDVTLKSLVVQTVNLDGQNHYTVVGFEPLGDARKIYSFPGDCNLDGACDGLDLTQFGYGYFGTQTASWATGDFNGDNVVDGLDLTLFGYGYFGPWGSAGGGGEGLGSLSAVPEPGTILMLVLGSLCLVGYRLRK